MNGITKKTGRSRAAKNGIMFEKKNIIGCRDLLRKKYIIDASKGKLKKYCDSNGISDKGFDKAHGCQIPDECFINEKSKTIFILEKKSQHVKGSTCEKLQTGPFKEWFFKNKFPNHNTKYIYY